MKNLDYLNSSVSKEIIEFKDIFIKKWWESSKLFPDLDRKTSFFQKLTKEKETNVFIDFFVGAIKSFPYEIDKRENWKQKIRLSMDTFLKKSDLMSIEDKNILLDTGMPKITQEFLKEAQYFNNKISMSDMGQAIRNVWIMNIVQLLLGGKPEMTTAVFAYSMLYPYTDNYLDNPNISKEEKILISDRFEKKLEGVHLEPNNSYEESLFKLVDMIETQYNPSEYPEIFQSLLSIHRAQIKSLLQQGRVSCPYEVDILGLSIEKGGASVLADAYLVNGKLDSEEAKFFFGYGVLLQICDDLQDGIEDWSNKHMTIISQLAGKWNLDTVTNGLINYDFEFLENTDCFSCDNLINIKELIRKNSLMLIFFAIAKNKKLYSHKYFKKMEGYFPYRTKYMINFYNKLRRKYLKMDESYGGVSIEEIIIFALS
ncbi:MAG: hypothetical protein H7Y18_09550 [Clostridiaceae bacterium]|nr:hypothetical protein [Clostridiaceae bacterium]